MDGGSRRRKNPSVISRVVQAFKVFVVMFALTETLWACPFCSPTDSDLYTVLENSNAVCKVARVGPNKFKILQVLKGKATVGKIVLARDPENAQGDRVLLLSTVSNPAQPYWSEPARALTNQEFAFFRGLLTATSESARQDIAAEQLLSRSKLVSDAAYNILAVASLEAVQKRADKVGLKNLVSAAVQQEVSDDRKAMVFLMLAPNVTSEDAAWLRGLLFRPKPNPQVAYLPALMAAYAEAAGPSAVTDMAQAFLTPKTSLSDSFQPSSGFKFIGTESKKAPTREAARKVVRQELSHPERGVFAIEALAKWRDYSVAPVVEQTAYKNAETPWVVGAAIRYFRTFSTPNATQALKRLEKEFPTKMKDYPKGY